MLVFFTIFPPKEISDEINKIRAKYDSGYTRLAPHITLIPPFKPTDDINKVKKKLAEKIAKIKPFYVELDGFGSFNKKLNSVIYIDVIDDENLKEVQTKSYEVLKKFGATLGKYKGSPDFHITIAKRLRFPKFKKINGELKDTKVTKIFKVNKITMCVIEKNEPWQIRENFKLGTKS